MDFKKIFPFFRFVQIVLMVIGGCFLFMCLIMAVLIDASGDCASSGGVWDDKAQKCLLDE
ncbi:MAG: hypothetical protein LBU87_05440 [Lactobacillales bacterium]|jgi:hypothetical protein|nr:hypothetical protein [Lactobacillales bacterium]